VFVGHYGVSFAAKRAEPAILGHCPSGVTRACSRRAGMLIFWSILGAPASLPAQIASRPLPTWDVGSLGSTGQHHLTSNTETLVLTRQTHATRSHTKTGLLIGGLIGVTATTVFLVAFCSDPDTSCGADEVGRAVLIIAVPCAAVGALVGSLVRTEE
jgi:hypothetical protein